MLKRHFSFTDIESIKAEKIILLQNIVVYWKTNENF